MSSNVPVDSRSKAMKLAERKMDMKEDRKLDRMAAEAQAFLLNNQKKEMASDLGSISSMGKGTIKDTTSVATKRCAKGTKATSKAMPSVGTGLGSFSKAGKSLAHKFM